VLREGSTLVAPVTLDRSQAYLLLAGERLLSAKGNALVAEDSRCSPPLPLGLDALPIDTITDVLKDCTDAEFEAGRQLNERRSTDFSPPAGEPAYAALCEVAFHGSNQD
jgi:hypothetical protein